MVFDHSTKVPFSEVKLLNDPGFHRDQINENHTSKIPHASVDGAIYVVMTPC